MNINVVGDDSSVIVNSSTRTINALTVTANLVGDLFSEDGTSKIISKSGFGIVSPSTSESTYVKKLKNFDGVIATGNNNSHRYFDYYFSKYPNLLRKTRHSIAVLDGNENDNNLAGLSNDIFNYFGLGCRSVSKVFLPRGYDLDILFNAFFSYKEIINHNKYVNNFDYNKAVYLMSKEKFIENGFLILKEETKLGSPIGCLFYEFYDDKKDILKLIQNNSDSIQCVASNLDLKTNIQFGQTQCPTIGDYADNNDTIKFLLKI